MSGTSTPSIPTFSVSLESGNNLRAWYEEYNITISIEQQSTRSDQRAALVDFYLQTGANWG